MAFDKPQSRNEAILQNMLGANNELEPPKSRVEALLQDIAGQMPEANPSEGTTTGTLERLKIGDEIYSVEGGGSGTSDYDALNNKPQIAGVTLSGDKSLADLGIASASAVSGILDGTDIDSFGDVETALGDKVDKVNGKGLSTNDYDDTEKAAVTAATTAIAGIKDGTTIDSFGDVETALGAIQDGQSIDSFADVESAIGAIEDGTTIDSFADVENALADKQDATDSNLQTTADTIVGAINEHESDIGSLKSGLTNLDNEVNGDATTYDFADVITIEDAIPANVANCSVKIEPVQDLHGYDKPWVGGAGKNLLDPSANDVYATITQLSNGVRFESPAVTGTRFIKSENSVLLKANTTYYFSCGNLPSNLGMSLRDSSLGTIYANVDNSYTPTTDVDAYLCYRLTDSETAIDAIITPQVEVCSQPTTFAPYTNLCPISGHTEVDVQRDGGNLFDPINVETFDATGQGDTRYGHRYNTGTYTIVNNMASESIFVRQVKNDLSEYGQYSTINALNYATINVADGYMLYVYYQSLTEEQRKNVCVNKGNDATFEPYQGKTYTIALGSTIYGGTVDFDSGVMTVNRALVDLGTLTWTLGNQGQATQHFYSNALSSYKYIDDNTVNYICENYEGIPVSQRYKNGTVFINSAKNVSIKDDNYNDTTAFTNAMDGVQLCYELATPTTIQLTPQQIQLLKGQNTLTASTGDISVTVNGVAGAIGSVQEQVNGLAEEVAEIKPVDYSTTEQKTGQKWIDGKDIYMKTLHVENAVMSGKNIEIDISSVNPDKCFIDYGASCAFDSDTNDWMSLSWVPAHAGVNYGVFAYADVINNGRKAVIISSAFDYGRRINNIYVTIRYTKTA